MDLEYKLICDFIKLRNELGLSQQRMADESGVVREMIAVIENQNIEREYNNALGVIADVENNLQALREAEGLLVMNNENAAQRDQLNAQLAQIKDQMAQNNAKLDSLNKVLQNSKRSNKELRATVKKLQNQIEEKTRAIDSLQIQLNERATSPRLP